MINKTLTKKIRNFAKKYHKDADYNHDMEHVDRTVKLAELLAKKEKANVDVCKVAAYLHDIGKKYNADIHGNHSAKIAEKYLKKNNFDKNFTKKVCHAIYCHDKASIHKAKTKEAKIVYDADKLQAIGPFGFCREFSHQIFVNKLKPRKAINIVKKAEIERYKKELQTKTGKKISKDQFNFMLKFYKMYDKWDKVKL